MEFGPEEERAGRSVTRREAMQARAAKLDRFGYSHAQIAERLKVSPETVRKLLVGVREEYKAAKLMDRDALVREKLELLRDVRMEASEEWERSRRDFEKTVNERADKGDYTQEKFVRTVEGRLATAEYMRIVLDTVKQERELLGLDAPTRTDLRAQVINIDWEALYAPPQPVQVGPDGQPLQLGHANPVEAALLLAEGGRIREAEALGAACAPSKGPGHPDLPVPDTLSGPPGGFSVAAEALSPPSLPQRTPSVGDLDEPLPPPLEPAKPRKKAKKPPKGAETAPKPRKKGPKRE